MQESQTLNVKLTKTHTWWNKQSSHTK